MINKRNGSLDCRNRSATDKSTHRHIDPSTSPTFDSRPPTPDFPYSFHVTAKDPKHDRIVICLDGIVRALLNILPFDCSWTEYVARASARRPDLRFIHLQQPYDWRELLSGNARPYEELLRGMADELLAHSGEHWEEVLVLGFSMGGLTALNLTYEIGVSAAAVAPKRLIFCTFGTPFGGPFDYTTAMIQRLRNSYLDRLYDGESTRRYFKALLDAARASRRMQLEIILHSIERDEFVPPRSALLPEDWLYFAPSWPRLKWESHIAPCNNRLRPHDGFLHDELACAYLDGLIDQLMPPAWELGGVEMD